MKPARWLLLVVAILAGALAAYLATRGSGDAVPAMPVVDGEVQSVALPQSQILVATASIGLGQRLSPEVVAWTPWPADAVRPEYVVMETNPQALEEITGAVARFEIFPGEPLTDSKLVRSDQGYLSAVLPKGMRGFSIPVTADSSAGGFIVPNDRVDVVLTATDVNPPTSETVLHNVRVLAIGKRLGENGTSGAPADSSVPEGQGFADATIATLELSPQQGEALANAKARGILSLALRSVADFDDNSTPLATQPSGVRIIRGGKAQALAQVVSPSTSGGSTPPPPATFDPAATFAADIAAGVGTMAPSTAPAPPVQVLQ